VKGKKESLKKFLEQHVVAIEEHIRVFHFGLAFKKKCIVRSRKRCIFYISTLDTFSYSVKGANPCPTGTFVNNRPNSKNFYTFFPNKKRLNRPKTRLSLLSLYRK
jgi:hypothetical protein